MPDLEVRFLGSGDAFGSGGRLQACILLRREGRTVLLDCGATALVSLRRFGVDPSEIEAILLSHLHGDHFGGLPFLILDAEFVSRRRRPLSIAGPRGTRERVEAAQDVFFAGSKEIELSYELSFLELEEGVPQEVGPCRVSAVPVVHPSGAPSLALRIVWEDRTVAYSGDTEWTESLIEVAKDADLFICECYRYDKRVPYHLDYQTLSEQRSRIECRRMVLTHLHQDMVDRDGLEIETATDGTRILL